MSNEESCSIGPTTEPEKVGKQQELAECPFCGGAAGSMVLYFGMGPRQCQECGGWWMGPAIP